MKKSFIFLLVLSFLFLPIHLSHASAKEVLKKTFEAALEAFYAKQYDKAIPLLEQSLKIYPDFAQAYYYLGLCYRVDDKKTDKAIEMFKKAIEKDPSFAKAYEGLGKLYYNLGEVDAAEENCLKALEHDPGLVSVQLSLGWIYLLSKTNPREAIYYFEQAVHSTDLSYAYLGLGMAYILDNQRYKVLGMITSLRQMGKENMALELERLTRKENFTLPNFQQAVMMRKKDEERIEAVQKTGTPASIYDKAGDIKVELKKQPAQPSRSKKDRKRKSVYSSPGLRRPNEVEASKAEDRIKALQQRGKSIFQ